MDGLTPSRFYGTPCWAHPDGGGLRSKSNEQCIFCRRDREKARRELESHKVKERAKNAARMRQYRSEGKHLANLREHTKRFQPKWADLGKIKDIYLKARELGQSVDHIIPLRGKLVCGLHVHNNLQILPKSANSSKGNKFEIEE